MQEAAAWLGRHRVTVQKWVKRYREGGLAQLLTHAPIQAINPPFPPGQKRP